MRHVNARGYGRPWIALVDIDWFGGFGRPSRGVAGAFQEDCLVLMKHR